MNIIPQYAFGGIGDFILMLPAAIEAKNIAVYSHFSKAKEFFEDIGVNVYRFEHIKDFSEMRNLFINGEILPHETYPNLPKLNSYILKDKKVKTFGLHIEGSEISNKFWSTQDKPTKNMSYEFVVRLCNKIAYENKNYLIYIFASPNRKNEILSWDIPHSIPICFDNIWNTLSCVQNCDYVYAMDSCIKTMAVIQEIPTTVFVGDYKDDIRDKIFLDPYIKDRIMKIIKFKNLDEIDITNL